MPGPCLRAEVQSVPPYLRESIMSVLCQEAKVQGVPPYLKDSPMPFPCLGAEVQGIFFVQEIAPCQFSVWELRFSVFLLIRETYSWSLPPAYERHKKVAMQLENKNIKPTL